jgi:hypothetical protein
MEYNTKGIKLPLMLSWTKLKIWIAAVRTTHKIINKVNLLFS